MNNSVFSYGNAYEQKLLALILKDKTFFLDIYEILKKEYFSNEYNSYIYRVIVEYFYEYKKVPTLDYFKIKIEDLDKDSDYKNGLVDALREVVLNKDAIDLDSVRKHSISFCRNQKMKEALYQSVDLLKDSKYDDIFTLMKDAVSYAVSNDVGHDYVKKLKSKYDEDVRNTIETPWEVINEVLNGGVAGGELHIVAGLPGTGKSWFLVSLGSHAIKLGYNVLHYTLELDENYTAFRYDSNIMNVSTDKLRYEDRDKVVSNINSQVKGRLIIKSMESYNTTTDSLEMHYDKVQLVDDFKPDLIIVDYPDLMVPTSRNRRKEGKEYQDIQDVYRELRGFSRRIDVPIWGVSQINKKGMEDDYIQEDKLASSFGKLMEADFLMSFSRKAEDLLANTCRFMILKNRFGPDKLKYTGKFYPYTGNIDIYFNDSVNNNNNSNYIQGKDDSETRIQLKNKFNNLFED